MNLTTNASLSDEFIHTLSLSRAFSVTIAAYFICVIIGGIFFNAVLIYTICTKSCLHTTSNYFIVNLAFCDLLRAVSILPFDSDYLIHGYYSHGIYICGLKEIAFMFSLPSAIVNLLLLTSERLLTLLFPFQYKVLFTKRRVIILLLMSWSYFLLVACFPLMYDPNAVVLQGGSCAIFFPVEYAFYQLIVNFITPLVCVLAMNCLIFIIASRSMRNQNRIVLVANQKQRMVRANYRAAKTIMILVGNVSVCWLTYITMVTSNILCGLCQPVEVIWVGCAINYTSIAVNPLLYGLLNNSIRKIIFKKSSISKSKSRDSYLGERTKLQTFVSGLKQAIDMENLKAS